LLFTPVIFMSTKPRSLKSRFHPNNMSFTLIYSWTALRGPVIHPTLKPFVFSPSPCPVYSARLPDMLPAVWQGQLRIARHQQRTPPRLSSCNSRRYQAINYVVSAPLCGHHAHLQVRPCCALIPSE
jgi:hypothetical protein